MFKKKQPEQKQKTGAKKSLEQIEKPTKKAPEELKKVGIQTTIKLSDKEKVLNIERNAELRANWDNTEYVMLVKEKIIATAKNELDAWKKALHSLL